MPTLIDLFSLKDLIPHGYCLSWSPVLLWLHVISDLLIMLAYYAIPLILIHFLRQRKDLLHPWLIAMFAGFIVACGTTHLLSAITVWIPLYWLDGLLKGFTAVLSTATAVLMLWLVPRALSLPSIVQLQAERQQRITAEEALRAADAESQKNAARIRLLMDSALDGIVSMDHNGNVIDWNSQAEHIFGYSSEQALGCKIAELIVPPAYREKHRQGLLRFMATGRSHIIGTRLEVTGLRADASEFPMELTVGALEQKGSYFFTAYVRDITERRKAEAAKQEAFERLHKIAGQLPGVVFQFRLHADGSSSLPYASEVLRNIYRIDPEAVKDDAAKVFAFVHPDDLDEHLASIQASARDLSPWRNEYRLKFADGVECWLFGNALPQREQDGSVLWHGVVTDITERKQMENALRESENKLNTILDSVEAYIYIKDCNYQYQYANQPVRQLFGQELEDIVGKLDDDFFDAATTAKLRENDRRIIELGERIATEEINTGKDSPITHTYLSVKQPLRHEDGSIYGLCGISTDITELKQMEEKLRDSDAFNVSILNSLTSHIAVLDAQGVIVAVNNAWRQFAEENGLPESSAFNYLDACENAVNQPYGDEAAAVKEGIAKVLAGEQESFNLEYPCHSATQQRWFHMNVSPLQGSRSGAVVSHKNITERKKAEELAQAASQYARSLIEASLDPLVTISAEGKITDVNVATEQVTGVNRGNMIGSDFADYFTDPDKARAGYQQAFSQDFVFDYPLAIRHVSGKVTDVLYNASVYYDNDGKVLGVFAAARDVTERKLIEDELKASEAKFRSIIEVSPIPMAMNDEQLNVTFLNSAFVQTFGYCIDDMPTLNDWWPKAYPDPEYRDWVKTTWVTTLEKAKREQTDFPPMEAVIRCKNNSIKTVLATAVTIQHDFAGMNLAILYDITQLKQVEAELTRSNAELEQFAYAVSHDMRQPLRMVTSYLSLIENALTGQLNEETQQFIDFAVNGAKRMDAMILSLLDYSRIGRKFEAKTRICSKASLDEALAFLKPELDACHGEIKVTGEWPELFASRDELTRLLQNLIGNALKYHEENKPPQVHIHGTAAESSLRVEVRDHGIGIEPSQMDRLFKVFSRLQARSRFDGTGVGLALCRKIVEHHGGTIGVESAGEGRGCVFWFELPLETNISL